jgi:hypothetical protein
MESFNWPAEHSEALRQYMAQGMSYSAAANAINKEILYSLYPECRDQPGQANGAHERQSLARNPNETFPS